MQNFIYDNKTRGEIGVSQEIQMKNFLSFIVCIMYFISPPARRAWKFGDSVFFRCRKLG